MGLLKSDHGRVLSLASLTSIGRHPQSSIVLEDNSVSNLHATLSWTTRGCWELRDAGSSNGTFVDDKLLAPGGRSYIRVGALISIGRARFELVDGGPPAPELRARRAGAVRYAESGMFDLSERPDAPTTLVEHANGEWWLEFSNQAELIHDGDTFTLNGVEWQLHLPSEVAGTDQCSAATIAEAQPLGGVLLSFEVTPDFEHAELTIKLGDRCIRSQGVKEQILAHLAHSRLMDQSDNRIHPAEHGWVYADDLCTWLNLNSIERLNVEIYRLRRYFVKCLVLNGSNVVQRRRGTGQLRIGTGNVRILKPA